MKKILVIVGHQNIKYNSITSLHGNTGTNGELEINIRIGNRLSEILRQRGYEVVQTDANGNDDPKITGTDFDLALSLHCDADAAGDNGGGMIGSGDKSVDMSWQESLRIKNVMDGIYFKETGIVNKNFVTEGMTKWYMWQYLSPKTPCVLIEMGQAMDAHDKVLLANTDLIANAILYCIVAALPIPEITPPTNHCEEEITNLKKEITTLKTLCENLTTQLGIITAKNTENEELAASWQKKYDTANKSLDNANSSNIELVAEKNKYKGWYETALKDQVNKYTGWQLIKMGISKLSIKK